MLNLGLNAAYISTGITLATPKEASRRSKGFGVAVAVQGLALLALDGYLLWQIRVG